MTTGAGTIPSGWNRKENHDAIEQRFRGLVDQAVAAKAHSIIVFSGNRKGMSDEQGLENTVIGLNRLKKYAETLLGFAPDYVFTHVTRLVPSKGLWRDVRVVEHLEKHLAKANQTAVLFVLSTETCGRARHDVEDMERRYKWPVAHREGHPDQPNHGREGGRDHQTREPLRREGPLPALPVHRTRRPSHRPSAE